MDDDHAAASARGPYSLWDAIATPSVRNVLVATVLSTALAAAAAAGYLALPATYASSAVLEIDQPTAIAGSGDAGVLDKLDRLRVKYAALVPTAPVGGAARAEAAQDGADAAGAVFAIAPANSLLLVVTAEGDARDDAVALARATSDRLVSYAEREQTDAGIPATERYRFEVIEAAGSAVRTEPTTRRALAVAAVAAVAGLAVVYAALQLATARRRLA